MGPPLSFFSARFSANFLLAFTTCPLLLCQICYPTIHQLHCLDFVIIFCVVHFLTCFLFASFFLSFFFFFSCFVMFLLLLFFYFFKWYFCPPPLPRVFLFF